jgi:hypothetical protein
MISRHLVGLLAIGTIAATVAPAFADANRAADFRSRNPGRWTALDFDAHGKLRHARTDDPDIVGTSVPWTDDDIWRLRGVLQIARDDLGGTADEREPTRIGTTRLGFMLFDDSTSLVTGFVELRRTGKTLDIWVAHAALDTDAAEKLLIGRRVTQTVTIGRPGQLDCMMGSVGRHPCRPLVVRKLRRDVVLTADDVLGASLALRVVGGAIKLTACVAAEHPVPENAENAALRDGFVVLANELAGMPLVVDMVMRKPLSIHPFLCL